MGAILSFLGGGAFRAIWGELASWITKRQDHKHEIEALRLQGELDAKQHERNLAAQKQAAELGYKTIGVQAEADISRIEAEGWRDAVAQSAKPTGIWLIDAWNGSVRPAFATVTITLWVMDLAVAGWVIGDWDRSLMGAIAGFYFADRTLRKLSK